MFGTGMMLPAADAGSWPAISCQHPASLSSCNTAHISLISYQTAAEITLICRSTERTDNIETAFIAIEED